MRVIRESGFYKWLWEKFKEFASSTCKRLSWPKYSGKMELTIHRKDDQNIIHFHLCVTDADRRHRVRQPKTATWAISF